MSFDVILNEIMRLKKNGRETKILGKNSDNSDNIVKKKNFSPSVAKHGVLAPTEMYSLGNKHTNVYFTRREAECMALLLRGKTIGKVAGILKLSPRTVEYYVKNMKSKLGCRTKFELLDIVYSSDFIKNARKLYKNFQGNND